MAFPLRLIVCLSAGLVTVSLASRLATGAKADVMEVAKSADDAFLPEGQDAKNKAASALVAPDDWGDDWSSDEDSEDEDEPPKPSANVPKWMIPPKKLKHGGSALGAIQETHDEQEMGKKLEEARRNAEKALLKERRELIEQILDLKKKKTMPAFRDALFKQMDWNKGLAPNQQQFNIGEDDVRKRLSPEIKPLSVDEFSSLEGSPTYLLEQIRRVDGADREDIPRAKRGLIYQMLPRQPPMEEGMEGEKWEELRQGAKGTLALTGPAPNDQESLRKELTWVDWAVHHVAEEEGPDKEDKERRLKTMQARLNFHLSQLEQKWMEDELDAAD